ncbi:MAG: alpha/beta fold hydrolase [Gemmatimonadota bacterium]
MTNLARRVLAGVALTVVAAAPARAQAARLTVTADDGHSLVVWERHPAGAPRGEIILLHGRTWSARPNFDLRVPGKNVSLIDALVARGYAVYALDQRGYGATARDKTGWLTPDRAEKDAENVADWVAARAPDKRKPALFGYSRGSATVMLAAQRHPAKVSGLILYGFYYDITGTPDLIVEPSKPPRERTTKEGAAEDFITPDSTPAGVKEAYIRSATTLDPVRVDWRREEQFRALDPAKVHTPTLVINGERDPYAKDANIPAFLAKLGTIDHWWIVLASADHVAHLERQAAFVQALVSFMERDGKPR